MIATMFKTLAKLFRPHLETPATPAPEVDEHLSDAQILREYFSVSQSAKQALRAFTLLISCHLGAAESKRLANQVMRSMQPGCSTVEALVEGLRGAAEQSDGQCLMIQLDWKAAEEIDWQAAAVAGTLNITDKWGAPASSPGCHPAHQALVQFGEWLDAHDYELLHIDTESDSYAAVAVPRSSRAEAIRLAALAGLKPCTNSEFAVHCD